MQSKTNQLARTLISAVLMFVLIQAIAASWEHPKLSRPEARYGFEKYIERVEGDTAFKVFVMSARGAWSWRIRHTFEQALNEALTACQGLASTAQCRLFAVGSTIVWDMTRDEQEQVIVKYKATKETPSINTAAPLGTSALRGFKDYQYAIEGSWVKVFVLAEDGSWAYRVRQTWEEALKDALDACEGFARRRGLCRLFAVGDTIVWDISDEERNAVIEAHKNKRKN